MELQYINYICCLAFIIVYWFKRKNGKKDKFVCIKFIGYLSLFILISLHFVILFCASSEVSDVDANYFIASSENTVLAITWSITGIEWIDNYFESKNYIHESLQSKRKLFCRQLRIFCRHILNLKHRALGLQLKRK